MFNVECSMVPVQSTVTMQHSTFNIEHPSFSSFSPFILYPDRMIVAPLGSGSAGNSTWFASDGTNILVDAGFGPRETKKRLEMVGGDIEQLAAIVITHEHYDHIRGAEKIAQKYGLPVYLTRGTLAASGIDQD